MYGFVPTAIGEDTVIPHWSFNATRSEQPEFEERILESLDSFYQERETQSLDAASPHDLLFREFPNFWRGFVRDAAGLQNGQLRISRSRGSEGTWAYVTDYYNESSGERLQSRFTAADDAMRAILAEWQVEATNTSDDSYEQYSAICRIDSATVDADVARRSELTIQTNGRNLRIPCPQCNGPVIALYALFDVVPEVFSGPPSELAGGGFLIADEMVSLLGPCSVRLAGTIDFPPAGELRGLCIFGDRLPPTYWWVDSQDSVVIMASTWRTLVASSARGSRNGGAR